MLAFRIPNWSSAPTDTAPRALDTTEKNQSSDRRHEITEEPSPPTGAWVAASALTANRSTERELIPTGDWPPIPKAVRTPEISAGDTEPSLAEPSVDPVRPPYFASALGRWLVGVMALIGLMAAIIGFGASMVTIAPWASGVLLAGFSIFCLAGVLGRHWVWRDNSRHQRPEWKTT